MVAEYPIVALSGAPNPDGAAAFVEYALSEEGQSILADFRFVHALSRAARRRQRARRPPALARVLGGLGLALFVCYPLVVQARIPWSRLPELLVSDIVGDALRLSLVASLAATVISVLVGVPLAWLLLGLSSRDGHWYVGSSPLPPRVAPSWWAGRAPLPGRRGLFGGPIYEAAEPHLPSPSET